MKNRVLIALCAILALITNNCFTASASSSVAHKKKFMITLPNDNIRQFALIHGTSCGHIKKLLASLLHVANPHDIFLMGKTKFADEELILDDGQDIADLPDNGTFSYTIRGEKPATENLVIIEIDNSPRQEIASSEFLSKMLQTYIPGPIKKTTLIKIKTTQHTPAKSSSPKPALPVKVSFDGKPLNKIVLDSLKKDLITLAPSLTGKEITSVAFLPVERQETGIVNFTTEFSTPKSVTRSIAPKPIVDIQIFIEHGAPEGEMTQTARAMLTDDQVSLLINKLKAAIPEQVKKDIANIVIKTRIKPKQSFSLFKKKTVLPTEVTIRTQGISNKTDPAPLKLLIDFIQSLIPLVETEEINEIIIHPKQSPRGSIDPDAVALV